MSIRRGLAWPMIVAVLGAGFSGCSDDEVSDAGQGTATEATPTPPAAVTGITDCLAASGFDVTPEAEPRFGSAAEIQVPVDSQGTNVGVFVYESVEDAEAAEQELVEAGSTSTEVVGTVVLSGSQDSSEAEFTEGVDRIVACAQETAG